MSTSPPPPFGYPPQGSPTPFDRRTARAQRRAAEAQMKAQLRWQRDQARLRMRAQQRRSLAGPVLLVTLGIVLLLLQTGRLHWAGVLTWLSVWWPAILIGAGIVMLIEWALDTRLNATGGSTPPRRILGGPAATLLVLLALTGAGLMAARRSGSWVQENMDNDLIHNGIGDWRQLFGGHSDFTQDLQAPLAPAGELTVDNPHGDLTITGSSEDGQVHVTVHQHLFTWQQDDLDSRRRREEPKFSGGRDHLILTTQPQEQDDADLTISLPHNASLILRSGHGDVSVEEVHGAATITAHDGDVKLTALRGAVRLNTGDDNATVTAHSLGSGLVLEGHSGDIDLSDVDGGVTLHGDFFGTTQLQRIRGQVNFQSSFTRFDCAGVPGSLVVEGRNDLTAHHLLGPLTINTSDRNVSLDGIRGAANITDRNGSVAVVLAGPVQPMHIADVNGLIEVSVPASRIE